MPHTWGPKAGRRQQIGSTPQGPPPPQSARAQVLFVCIGNSCRSQMAEGFALLYGKDVMEVSSAGLAPAQLVAPLTRQVMLASRGIDLSAQWPKSIFNVSGPFDMIVNISGHPLPARVVAKEVRTWTVHDPVSDGEAVQLEVANQIESLVQQLILEFRNRKI
jgi:arsenate reductase (thioredoxin)